MDGELITCSECNGEGFVKHQICSKCSGCGTLDWVENVVGKTPKNYSTVDNINMRRLLTYIDKNVSIILKQFIHEPINKNTINSIKTITYDFLDDLKSKHIIVDHLIKENKSGSITIKIKPQYTSEIVAFNYDFYLDYLNKI